MAECTMPLWTVSMHGDEKEAQAAGDEASGLHITVLGQWTGCSDGVNSEGPSLSASWALHAQSALPSLSTPEEVLWPACSLPP